MPLAAGVVDRNPVKQMVVKPPLMTAAVSEVFAKDAIIAWFRGEFAAANAIIDVLCRHLMQMEGGGGGGDAYHSVFAAIHRRRLNWIPILQMQEYYSIAGVTMELEKVAEKKREVRIVDAAKEVEELASGGCTPAFDEKDEEKEKFMESSVESSDDFGGETVDEDGGEVVDDSPQSEITDSGSPEVQSSSEHTDICSNHEVCEARQAQIKMTNGFVAKELVKGHMVNVVKGLRLFEDIFTDVELSKLNEFVNELRMAGRNGELSGETFISYNQQIKGNRRELIQFGVPIFGQIKEHSKNALQTGYLEPIPALLQNVTDHLIQWNLIPENRKPNSCIINFFDEGEYSQPFLKPPHLDQPLSTLLLSESKMAFGHTLLNDNSEGNYRGPLTLSLKEGSLLVMTVNSADRARHAMCSSQNKRATISFFRVRSLQTETERNLKSTTLRQPGVPTPYTTQNNCKPLDTIPKCGFLHSPVVMLAPVSSVTVSPKATPPRSGTGVFLPWTVGLQNPAKHHQPSAQR